MKKWIGRVAVQFDDRRDPSAEVTGCADQLVFVSKEISLPLSAIEVSEDMCHHYNPIAIYDSATPSSRFTRKRMM